MCNSVTISVKTLPKAEAGDEVQVTISGVIVEEDGQRKIEISHVDGKPVESMKDCSSCGERSHDMEDLPDSNDALMTFIKVIKPKK